jgi:hypothetical protein
MSTDFTLDHRYTLSIDFTICAGGFSGTGAEQENQADLLVGV